jgi:ABC-2 type transport system permease protein
MRPNRVLAIARKELLHVIRDPRSLGMAIAIPMLLLLLFGYALTLDVDRVPLAVWDQSHSPASRDLVSRLDASRYFSIVAHVERYTDLERSIDAGRALAALVVPRDFAAQLASGRNASVQAIVDGSDSNTATIVLGYLESVVLGFSADVALRGAQRSGMPRVHAPIDLHPRVWFNADLESKNYIVPGLIAVIMAVIAALLTSLTFAREWEQGTMEQLIATPVRPSELVFGKLLPYFGIGFLDVLLAVAMGEWLFRVPLRGDPALLLFMASVFLSGALSLGMLISIVAKRQLVASQLAMIVTFLPSFLLSGFMYAIENMPAPIQAMTHVIPARYFVALLKGIYLKGVGLEVLWVQAGLLSLFGIAMVAIATRAFRKRLE